MRSTVQLNVNVREDAYDDFGNAQEKTRYSSDLSICSWNLVRYWFIAYHASKPTLYPACRYSMVNRKYGYLRDRFALGT